MDKQGMLVELMDFDFDTIKRANERNKEIGRLFVQGLNYRQIGKMYSLSPERIRQIINKLARWAAYLKRNQADSAYHELVEMYKEKILRGETLVFHSTMEDMSRHLSASCDARECLLEAGLIQS